MPIVITDLGNDIQFDFTNTSPAITSIYTLNKLSLRVKQDNTHVYVTNADGFIQSQDNKVISLKASEVTSPVFADNDELFAGLVGMASGVSLGSSGGGGGGSSTYSNAQGDFIATTTTGTKNITITGLPFTLEDIHVSSVTLYNSTGDRSTLALTNVVVSGGVITLGGIDDFESGDSVLVYLVGPDKAYDEGVDSKIVSVLNPDSAKWTSPEHLVDLAEDAVTQYFVIPMEGFKDLSAHWKFTGGGVVTMTLWGTNNADADDSAVTNWVDISGDFLSKTLTVSAGTIEFAEVLENLFFLKVMVRLVTTGSTNIADIYIKKKSL